MGNGWLLLLGAGAAVLVFVALWRRPRYDVPKAVFEGGGIRRGLTPPEAAAVLGESFSVVVQIALWQLFEKGFIQVEEAGCIRVAEEMRVEGVLSAEKRREARLAGAQALGGVLYPYEEFFLEVVGQNEGKRLEEMDFGIVEGPFMKHVEWRMGGYDLEGTRGYLREFG